MNENTMNNDVTMAGEAGRPLFASRYRIIRQLGQGGMGSVWLAEDTQLDGKLFAIKMLPSILVANKRAYAQLKSEALVAMKLVHPNIVQIRAFEENNGNPFLVMDYIRGKSLDRCLVDWGNLNSDEVSSFLMPIAEALDYAHSKGVVHRDVKPSNIIVAEDGTPYVLDFGIAREIQETMTFVTGKMSSGTLMYMSPEQLHGHAPKKFQDIYSFAAMVYECLTGRPPFCRGQIEYQIDHDDPEPLSENIAIAASVMAGLAKNPENRPEGCVEVLKSGADIVQLTEYSQKNELSCETDSARVMVQQNRKKRQRLPLQTIVFAAIGTAIALLCIIGTAWHLVDSSAREDATKAFEEKRIAEEARIAVKQIAKVEAEKAMRDAERVKLHLECSKREAEQAKRDAEQFKKEAERIKLVAEQSRLDAAHAQKEEGKTKTSATSQSALAARTTSAPTLQYKFEYKLDDKGNAILYGGPMPKPKGVLVIPDKIDGRTVTEIEGDCFRCEEVTRIVLPPHLEKLRGTTWNRVHTPGHKFGGCYNLESIEISPANQSFTSVNGALYTKDKKRLIVYPKTRSSISLARECNEIGESAFSDCKKFKTVKIPDSVTRILTAAFLGCENMETVEFPKGVKVFGVYVFPRCPDLRKVVFHGDAPGHWVRRMRSGARDTLLSHSNYDIVIEVEKDSKGWAGKNSTTLPARWPLDGNGFDSRPIRYIGDVPPYRKAGVAKGWKVEVAVGYCTGNVPNEQFLDSGNNASDNYPVLAFSTGGTKRASSIGAERVSFPGNPGTVRFTSRSKGTMRVPAAGDWTFAVQCNDGYRVKISGNGYSTSFSGEVTGARCHTVTLPSAGNYEVEVLHGNTGGPACLDFSAAKGRFTDFRPSEFKLVGDPTGQIKMVTSGK